MIESNVHFVSILNFIKPELIQQDSIKLVTDENMYLHHW